MRWDAETADVRVYTFKAGLLSAVAHDLELRVTAFVIDVPRAAPGDSLCVERR